MFKILALTGPQTQLNEIQEEQVRVQTFSDYSVEGVTKQMVSIKGSVEIYCWYEGRRGLLQTCVN